MKNRIIIQNTDQKFLNHIALSKLSDTCDIYQINVHNAIYEIFYKLNPKLFILDALTITKEIYQFVEEFKDTIKICIYHQNASCNKILSIDNVTHLIDYDIHNIDASKNIIRVPILLNKHLYENIHNKNQQIVCFLDNTNHIDEKLASLLYPQSKQKILMYHNKNIQHPQNMGMVSEKEKVQILRNSSHYLCINGLYLYDAVAAGCHVHTISDIQNNQNIFDIKTERYTIDSLKNAQEYSDFIRGYL